jgi:hypothetical protein
MLLKYQQPSEIYFACCVVVLKSCVVITPQSHTIIRHYLKSLKPAIEAGGWRAECALVVPEPIQISSAEKGHARVAE